LRLLDIWCRLRGYGEGHLIRDRKKKMASLATFCECSVSKLRYMLMQLQQMGWLHFDDYCIAITSEAKVYSLCGIDHNRAIDRIYYKPEKIKNEKQSFYWLYVAEIDDNRKRQAYTFTKNLLNTSDINAKIWIKTFLLKRGYDVEKTIGDTAIMPKLMQAVYLDSFTKHTEDEIHEFLVKNRPDVNRSVYGIADAWSVSPQTVSDVKKQIRRRCLVDIVKLGTISSRQWARNGACHRITRNGIETVKGTLWNARTKETFQAICDDIVPRMDARLVTSQGFPDFKKLVREALERPAA
jgi:hypothetical protein